MVTCRDLGELLNLEELDRGRLLGLPRCGLRGVALASVVVENAIIVVDLLFAARFLTALLLVLVCGCICHLGW